MLVAVQSLRHNCPSRVLPTRQVSSVTQKGFRTGAPSCPGSSRRGNGACRCPKGRRSCDLFLRRARGRQFGSADNITMEKPSIETKTIFL